MSGEGRPDGTIVDAAGLRLAIAGTRWNAEITDCLLARAGDAARACGIASLAIVRVAGAVELPVVAAAFMAQGFDAVTCVGAVIRGGTPHFDYVCDAVTAGLTRVALDAGKPVGNGVLTCNTMAEARDRAGFPGSAEDKGWEAVVAALDTALLLRDIRSGAFTEHAPRHLQRRVTASSSDVPQGGRDWRRWRLARLRGASPCRQSFPGFRASPKPTSPR